MDEGRRTRVGSPQGRNRATATRSEATRGEGTSERLLVMWVDGMYEGEEQ